MITGFSPKDRAWIERRDDTIVEERSDRERLLRGMSAKRPGTGCI